MRYWDTSALLKLYVREPDSPLYLDALARFLDALARFGQPPITAELTRVELFSALRRREQTGGLVAGAADSLFQQFCSDIGAGRVRVVPQGADVSTRAVALIRLAYQAQPPLMARSLDVLYAASANLTRCRTLVDSDVRQRALAQLAGLKLFP